MKPFLIPYWRSFRVWFSERLAFKQHIQLRYISQERDQIVLNDRERLYISKYIFLSRFISRLME